MESNMMSAADLQSTMNRSRFPKLGVVLAVRYSDARRHRWRQVTGQARASWCEVVVQIIDGGLGDSESTVVAMVPTPTPGGLLSRSERPIRACSMALDGTTFASAGVPLQSRIDLDGDWCIVDFLGGLRDKAYVVGWVPHPANQTDLATEGNRTAVGSPQRTLDQRERWYEKIQGIDVVVTPQGDVYMDTSTAGEDLKGAAGGYEKQELPGHGRFLFSVTGEWEWNFNPAVEDPSVPWVPQTNPAVNSAAPVRENTKTVVRYSEDEINLIAAQVARLMARGGPDSVLVGGTPEAPPTLHPALAEPLAGAFDANAGALGATISKVNDICLVMGIDPLTVGATDFPESAQATDVLMK